MTNGFHPPRNSDRQSPAKDERSSDRPKEEQKPKPAT
jgi:hypothetical protein